MGKGVILQSRNVRSLLFDSLIKILTTRGGYSLSFAQVGLVLFTQTPTEIVGSVSVKGMKCLCMIRVDQILKVETLLIFTSLHESALNRGNLRSPFQLKNSE